MKRVIELFKVEKNHETVQKTLRLPCPLAEEAEKKAVENNISFNCLVVQCIRYALDNIESEEEEE